MHTGFTIDFDHAWLAGRELPRDRGRVLLRLLEELSRSGSLREAARRAGVSYRAAWGALGDGARLFGTPLVDMQRGRRASLSALGRKVLAADERVRERLGEHFERLRAEIPAMLADILPGTRPRIALHASHDLALAELSAACRQSLDLEIVIRGADENLAALARGECDMAGFHVADALPRAAAAAAALGRWLDPRKHTLIHFVDARAGPDCPARLAYPRLARPRPTGGALYPPAVALGRRPEASVAEEVAAGPRRRRLRAARRCYAPQARLHPARHGALLLRLRESGASRRGAQIAATKPCGSRISPPAWRDCRAMTRRVAGAGRRSMRR